MFIALEGIDNTGKSTLSLGVKRYLEGQGTKVRLVADPPKERPWGMWKDEIQGSPYIGTPARATLFLAGRLDAVERVIKPALEDRDIVVADRYYASWFAYQITKLQKRKMSRKAAFDLLYSIHSSLEHAGLIVQPDRVYLLTGDPRILAERGKSKSGSVYDEVAEQATIQKNFLWVTNKLLRDRTKVVNVDTKSADEVCKFVCRDLARFID